MPSLEEPMKIEMGPVRTRKKTGELNVEAKTFDQISETLQKVHRHEDFRKAAIRYAEWLHENKAFKAVRKSWDSMPYAVQWGMIKGEESFPVIPKVFGVLIEMGLLKYKGHKTVEEREKDIKKKRESTQTKTKWALRIGSVFEPALAKLLPFLKPAEKLQNSQAAVLAEVRRHMDTLRIETETSAKARDVLDKAA
jgi:hypothetical protein